VAVHLLFQHISQMPQMFHTRLVTGHCSTVIFHIKNTLPITVAAMSKTNLLLLSIHHHNHCKQLRACFSLTSLYNKLFVWQAYSVSFICNVKKPRFNLPTLIHYAQVSKHTEFHQ